MDDYKPAVLAFAAVLTVHLGREASVVVALIIGFVMGEMYSYKRYQRWLEQEKNRLAQKTRTDSGPQGGISNGRLP